MSDKEIYRDYTIEYTQDEDSLNPREWGNMCTFVANHRRYYLGDEQLKCHNESWDDDFKQHLKEKGLKLSDVFSLSVYMLDHSGLRFSTSSFGCPWDSGQVGFIYVSKATVRKEYSLGRITAEFREKAYQQMVSEIKTFDDWNSGNVYMYHILDPQGEEIFDWCGEYYGDGFIAEAKSYIDNHIKLGSVQNVEPQGTTSTEAVA